MSKNGVSVWVLEESACKWRCVCESFHSKREESSIRCLGGVFSSGLQDFKPGLQGGLGLKFLSSWFRKETLDSRQTTEMLLTSVIRVRTLRMWHMTSFSILNCVGGTSGWVRKVEFGEGFISNGNVCHSQFVSKLNACLCVRSVFQLVQMRWDERRCFGC